MPSVCVSLFCLPVNGLTDGSSWRAVATIVGIYVLLKFLQGGGAGRSNTLSLSLSLSLSISLAILSVTHFLVTSPSLPSPPIPRCLWVCQQPALLPVDPRAAVHQPRGPGAPLRPPALAVAALAPGPQDGRRAAQHRPRDLLHQQPAQVRRTTNTMSLYSSGFFKLPYFF